MNPNPEQARQRTIASVNPTTGELWRSFEPDTEDAIEGKLQLAASAFNEHGHQSFAERARWMMAAADALDRRKREFAGLMTREMGKPIRAAVQEVEKCARTCRYFAENAERFLATQELPAESGRGFVRYQPLGIILAVMPWNFPFWQVFRFAAPALMAGNAGLLKHASNVPQCALAIEEVFRAAGFPEGVFQTLLIGSDRVEKLIADPRIAAVTLTGSVNAGRSIASAAGRHIKKTVLELGGSDPFLVMPSADLERAIATAVQARTINNGQSCIAAKRFIVHREIADRFEREFCRRMAALKIGDPMHETTDLGPLATRQIVAELEAQVRRSIEGGAKLLLGGKRIDGPGNFYAPTVLSEVPTDSPAYRDELFGPVAALFRADDVEDAVRLANDTRFGLGACLWSGDRREQEYFVDRIEAGAAFLNGMVASQPALPFGGIRESGYGRELGEHGIREFVNIKTVCVAGGGAME